MNLLNVLLSNAMPVLFILAFAGATVPFGWDNIKVKEIATTVSTITTSLFVILIVWATATGKLMLIPAFSPLPFVVLCGIGVALAMLDIGYRQGVLGWFLAMFAGGVYVSINITRWQMAIAQGQQYFAVALTGATIILMVIGTHQRFTKNKTP